MSAIIAKINKEQTKQDVTPFNVGDAVRVHTRVVEGDKERIQIYSGIVIGRRGTDLNETFTVRRISYGEGVERVFPIHSPRVAKIEVETQGTARRAKLTYLRTRKGKQAMAVREKKVRSKSSFLWGLVLFRQSSYHDGPVHARTRGAAPGRWLYKHCGYRRGGAGTARRACGGCCGNSTAGV